MIDIRTALLDGARKFDAYLTELNEAHQELSARRIRLSGLYSDSVESIQQSTSVWSKRQIQRHNLGGSKHKPSFDLEVPVIKDIHVEVFHSFNTLVLESINPDYELDIEVKLGGDDMEREIRGSRDGFRPIPYAEMLVSKFIDSGYTRAKKRAAALDVLNDEAENLMLTDDAVTGVYVDDGNRERLARVIRALNCLYRHTSNEKDGGPHQHKLRGGVFTLEKLVNGANPTPAMFVQSGFHSEPDGYFHALYATL